MIRHSTSENEYRQIHEFKHGYYVIDTVQCHAENGAYNNSVKKKWVEGKSL